jgi:hypothetical protein
MALAGAVLVQQSFEHALCIGTGGCSPNLLFTLPGVGLEAGAVWLAYGAWRAGDDASGQPTSAR